jgi:5-dehydro-2-deoxygluconokinase
VIDAARAAGGRVVLDIDYRPVLWGLRPKADGETRYVAAPPVSAALQRVIPDCDLVVGTEEELCIAGGADTSDEAVLKLRAITTASAIHRRSCPATSSR